MGHRVTFEKERIEKWYVHIVRSCTVHSIKTDFSVVLFTKYINIHNTSCRKLLAYPVEKAQFFFRNRASATPSSSMSLFSRRKTPEQLVKLLKDALSDPSAPAKPSKDGTVS